jgi:hypothetical protein
VKPVEYRKELEALTFESIDKTIGFYRRRIFFEILLGVFSWFIGSFAALNLFLIAFTPAFAKSDSTLGWILYLISSLMLVYGFFSAARNCNYGMILDRRRINMIQNEVDEKKKREKLAAEEDSS